MSEIASYGIIILAAGNSSRLGEPKQLLQFRNKSLIRHVADAAIEAINTPVIVVTGSNPEIIARELRTVAVKLVENSEWSEGMASSIRTGLSEILRLNSPIEGVIITVSDQPFVSSDLFTEIIKMVENSEKGIVASSYENALGTPVLFTKRYFESLLLLKGAEGARKLLKQFADDVTSIPFPSGSIDIDTREDYQGLLGC